MQIFGFLKIIQRIMLFIVIGGFVPLTVYVFSAHTLNVDNRTNSAYQMIQQQILSGYILNVRRNCTLQQAISFPTYCFNYCLLGSTCEIVPQSNDCTIGSALLSLGNFKYCASTQINNLPFEQTSSPYIQLSTNPLTPPLFTLQSTINDPVYYIFNGQIDKTRNTANNNKPCRNVIETYGQSLWRYELESERYLISMSYLFYSLIPTYALTVLSVIIQVCTRYECKRIMQVSILNSSIFSLSIIVIGVIFDVKCSQIESDVKYLGTNCLIDSTFAEKYKNFLLIDMPNGLTTGFTIAVGIIGVLNILLIVSLAIIGFIQAKMNKLKKQDYSSGYQLHTV